MRYIYITFILLFFSCSTTKNFKVESEFIEDYNVYAWYDIKKNSIWAISLPISVNITNDNIIKELLYYQYNYKRREKGKAINFYEFKGDSIVVIENFKKKKLNINKQYNFLIQTKHIITNTELADKIISKLNTKGVLNDSISLGSFKEFKQEYTNTIRSLVDKDTLYLKFNFFENSNNKRRRIKIPIKF